MKKTPIPTKWDIRLGRMDSPEEPSKKILAPGASSDEVRSFYNELGAKPGSTSGPFAGLPPFSEKVSFLLYSAAQDDPTVRITCGVYNVNSCHVQFCWGYSLTCGCSNPRSSSDQPAGALLDPQRHIDLCITLNNFPLLGCT